VFAKQKLSPSHSRGLALPCVLLAFLFACLPSPARADSLEDAARALALKLCAAPRQQVVKVHWTDLPLPVGTSSDSSKHAFLGQLSACGMDAAKESDGPILNVSIQLTVSRIVLVADLISSLEARRIQMVEVPRSAISISSESSSTLRLRKQLIWQQESSIDSAAEWDDESSQQHLLLLLSQDFLVRLRLDRGSWTAVDSTEIPASGRKYRLAGGRFGYNYPPGPMGVFSDGKFCGMEIGTHISFVCRDTSVGGTVVTISSACDETRQILATGSGDDTERDRITLAGTEVIRATPLSEDEIRSGSVEVPGPVLAINTVEHGKAVTAVVRNLSTGIYEVYRITTVCSE
jgi:hypothetical protein